MLEKNVYLVADCGQGLADGAGRDFEYGSGIDANGSQAPGLQTFFDVDDNSVAVKIHSIDGEAHGEGVDTVGGAYPQSLASREAGRICRHQSAKARPVST